MRKTKIIRKSLLAASIFLLVAAATGVFAQTEKKRIERLSDLARIWGTVKYFHPYLAYRDVDWDKALIETIPQVNVAKTPQEYSAAINHLLSFLNDKNTYASIAGKAKETPVANAKEFLRLENGVFFINPVLAAKTREQNQNTYAQILEKNMPLLAQAKSIIIDGRGSGDKQLEAFDFYFDDFFRQIFTQILDANVPLGVYRYRMHNGYASQTGVSSGGYYSAMVTTAPETITGQNKNKMLPTVFLINEQTPVSSAMLSGLQATNKIFIVQEGEGSLETGIKTFEMKLPDNVTVKMRTAELVNPDGTTGFQPDEIVPQNAGEGKAMKEVLKLVGGEKPNRTHKQSITAYAPQIAPKDKVYAEMTFPNSEYRLLALFRFWNVINYFFPYKHLTDKPWDDVLPLYIPKFEANKDAADYQLTVRNMVAEIQDSHGFVTGTPAASERWGKFLPPFDVKFIENQTIVDYVFDNVKDVKVGDAILAINGEPIERFRERYSGYFAASTPQALVRVLYPNLLRGQENSRMKLTLRGIDNSIREVEIARTVKGDDKRWEKIDKKEKPLPAFTVMPSGFGYVDLDRLELGDVGKMFETIKNTSATIFDMRGYPKGTAWEIAPRLTEKTNVAAALFSNPIWEAINLGDPDYVHGTTFGFTQYLPERKGDVYKGKVVMLINEYAQSQAEQTCMFFEAATNVTFIGTPTAGGNGDITDMVLPGNITASFSGHDVRHADGRVLQRVGIQPTIRVEPTIRGMVEGRDQMLDAAIKFLQSNKTVEKREE